MTPSSITPLATPLRVRLGQRMPESLQGAREVEVTAQVLQRLLTTPMSATQWPTVVAMLFNLCGQAHRWCSSLALAAVGALPAPDPSHVAHALRHETALEHLRRMALDWPRLLRSDAADRAAESAALSVRGVQCLHACPIWSGTPTASTWLAMRDWLAQHVLGVPVATWWQAWQDDPQGWITHWSRQRATWVAQWLADVSICGEADAGTAVLSRIPALALPHDTWPAAPSAQHIAQTGTWTRACDAHLHRPTQLLSLLGARLADLVALSLPDALGCGTHRLAHGATRYTDETGQVWGVAWVEMARGLLCHRVRVSPSADGAWHVEAAALQAPTDWNMHAHGPMAHLLDNGWGHSSSTPPTSSSVARWMAAFDPCVPFVVEPWSEESHRA